MLFEEYVSEDFKNAVIAMSGRLGINPDDIMTCMAFESEKTFSPSITNSIGATGLIQFMPSTAIGLGTTTAALAQMSAVDQLQYVEKYLQNVSNHYGKLDSLVNVYLAIFYPAAIAKPLNYQFSPAVVKANPVFDIGHKGYFTKQDVSDTITAWQSKALGE